MKNANRINKPPSNWFIPALLILALLAVGLVASSYLSTFTPLWLSLGFGCVFSVDRWLRSYTLRHKTVGKFYRLLLNLCILSLFGLLVWTSFRLFSRQLFESPVVASLFFIAELVLFIWLWKVVSRNSWRWPSMKLTVFSLICLFLIFSFAGVQPITSYKDGVITYVSSKFSSSPKQIILSSDSATPLVTKTPNQIVTTPPTATVVKPLTIPTVSTPVITTVKPLIIPTVSTPVITTVKPLIIPTVSIPVITTVKPVIIPTASIPAMADIMPGLPSSIIRTSFQSIDQYALSTPASVTKSVADLAAYLIKPAKNDFDKARSIYRWVTQNISYDFSAYLSGRYNSMAAADVLTTRSSVCQGYASLFTALAKSGGLEVVTLSGWAKGYSYGIGDQISGPTNHAWNAVKIGGAWYLLDPTWGAGYISQQQFVRNFDEFYFLAAPEQFIYNHFPEDPRWQLLSVGLSQTEFSALPFVYSDFFKYGINLGNNTRCTINVKGTLNLTLSVPSDTYLMARIRQGDIELADTLSTATRSGNQYIITASFPGTGDYTLTVYASKSMYSMYDGVVDYKIVVTN